MRVIGPFFLLLTLNLPSWAETQSASEFQSNCINDRITNCVTTVPDIEPGQQGDTSKCTSSAMQSLFTTACAEATKTYCDSYMTNPDFGATNSTSFTPPAGCQPTASAAAPKVKKPPTPSNTGGTQVDIAQARSDLKQCQSMQTKAQGCCGNPASCGGQSASAAQQNLVNLAQQAQQNGDADGLKQICSQASDAGTSGINLDSSYANVCAAKHTSCSDACGQVYTTWNKQASSCTGDSCSELSSLVAQMKSQQNACISLSSTEDALKAEASREADNTRLANICVAKVDTTPSTTTPTTPTTLSGTTPNPVYYPQSNPSDQLAQNQPDPTQQQPTQVQPQQVAAAPPLPVGNSECATLGNIGSCVNCAQHPEYPSCGGSGNPAAANNFEAQTEGSHTPNNPGVSNFAGATTSKQQGLTGPDGMGIPNNDTSGASANARIALAKAAAGNAPIGAFPPLDPKDISGSLLARAQMVAAKTGVKTDIFAGERSGGYSAPNNVVRAASSGFERSTRSLAGYGLPSYAGRGQKNYIGLDLKHYLPGGQFDPGRRFSGMGLAQSEIGPMSTNMFERVSLRFRLICISHGLIDCN